jgi:hypothetical protein
MDSWFFLSFFFPAELVFWDCGSGRDEEPSGEKVLRLIQIRLATPSFEKIPPVCQTKNSKIVKRCTATQPGTRIQSAASFNQVKNSPRRARRTQRKTIKSLAAVNSVSSVVRFRFSNRSNPSRASAAASRCLPQKFCRDIFFLRR